MPEDIPWQGEKPWPNGRIIESFISSPMVDLQNELLTEETFKQIMPWFNENGVYTWYHSDLVIGKPIGFRFRGGNAEAKFGIFDSQTSGIPYHDEVWKILQRYGTKGSSSIRGVPTGKSTVCIDNRCFKKITDIGLWAVGWVGQDPANVGATVNRVSFAKSLGPEVWSQKYWIEKALGSGDAEIRNLTKVIVKFGLAKEYSEERKMEEKIRLRITDKAIVAMAKGMPITELIVKCPKCREFLAKLEAAGIDTNVAVTDINAQLQAALSKPFGGYKDFAACVAANSDKEDPEAYCATIMRAIEGKAAGQRYGGFEAPEPASDYTDHQKTVLAHVYAGCRENQESEGVTDKEKCAKIAHAAAQNAKSMTVLFPWWDGDTIKKDGRPPEDWWDACIGRAQSFADVPEEFCGWLWASGPPAQQESMGKGQGQATPPGGGVDKEGVTMADKPKDTTEKQAPPPAEGVKKEEPKTEDYMALIKAQEVEIASLKAEMETLKTSKGDFAKVGEEMKKALEDWGKKFSELSERVLGIEGKIGQPAGSGKSRGQSPEDIKNAAIDWSKINSANDVLGLIAPKK